MASSFSSKQTLTLAIDAVLVLAAACHETFAWAHWPVYAAALGAQLVLSMLFACLRKRLREAERPSLPAVAGLPTVIDIVLTLPALSVAAVAGEAPSGTALTWAVLFAIAGGVLSERSGRPTSETRRCAQPGRATPGSAARARGRLPQRRSGSSTFTEGSCLPSAGAAGRPRRPMGCDPSCLVARSAPATSGHGSAAVA